MIKTAISKGALAAVIFFTSSAVAADLIPAGEIQAVKATGAETIALAAPPVAKAARNLRAGTILHVTDLIFEGGTPAEIIAFKELLTGKELKRTTYAGAPLPLAALSMPTVVKRNAIVTIEFIRGPLVITTEGRALDPGAVGDTVRVMNLKSRVTLSATIIDANKVVTK